MPPPYAPQLPLQIINPGLIFHQNIRLFSQNEDGGKSTAMDLSGAQFLCQGKFSSSEEVPPSSSASAITTFNVAIAAPQAGANRGLLQLWMNAEDTEDLFDLANDTGGPVLWADLLIRQHGIIKVVLSFKARLVATISNPGGFV